MNFASMRVDHVIPNAVRNINPEVILEPVRVFTAFGMTNEARVIR
jgi:hypothetical protein